MKIKREFILREVAGETLLVPTGKTAIDLKGMLTLNTLGAEIWRMLPECENSEQIVCRILQDYDAEAAQVRADVDEFLQKLKSLDIL